jgi:hypothetical protein
MNEIDFCCKGCVFAETVMVMGQETQTGCMVDNRHKKLSKDNKTKDGYSQFNRFCNAYRPNVWLQENNQSLTDAVETVKKEVYPRTTFIIKFNKDLEFLQNLLNTINNQTIDNRKFVVVINDQVEYNVVVFDMMSKALTNNIGGFNLMQIVDTDKEFDEAFANAKNGWTIFLEEGEMIETNLAEKLNRRVNQEMRRIVYAQDASGKKTIVQSAIYKALGGNQPLLRSDGTVDTRSFVEKLQDMNSEDSDSITTWETLFDA